MIEKAPDCENHRVTRRRSIAGGLRLAHARDVGLLAELRTRLPGQEPEDASTTPRCKQCQDANKAKAGVRACTYRPCMHVWARPGASTYKPRVHLRTSKHASQEAVLAARGVAPCDDASTTPGASLHQLLQVQPHVIKFHYVPRRCCRRSENIL